MQFRHHIWVTQAGAGSPLHVGAVCRVPTARRAGGLVLGSLLGVMIGASAFAQGQAAQQVSSLLAQGQQLAAAGRLAEAEEPLEQAAGLAPRDAQVLTLLARVKGRMGHAAEAAALLRRVTEAEPRSVQAHLDLALALADAGDTSEALREVEHSIRLDPTSAPAHLNRARMLADAGHVIEARAEFTRAAQLAPDDTKVEYFRAAFESAHGDLDLSATLLAKVVAAEPQNVAAYLLLAKALATLHRQSEAVVAWRHVIALDTVNEEALYALYQALRVKQPGEAAGLLKRFHQVRAAKQQTEQARELGNQAYAAMQVQHWQYAIEALQQALSLCGECVLQAGLHQRLGLAQCHSGDLTGGERELRLALSLDPEDRTAVEALAWIGSQREQGSRPH